MKRSGWIVLLILSSCRGCDCGDTTIEVEPLRATIAHCAEAAGEVRRRKAAATAWAPLSVGAELASGDWVQTAAAAAAKIDFLSGSQLSVGPSSVIVIEPPQDAEDGELLAGQVTVQKGTVRGRVLPRGERRTLLVTTPEGKQVRLAASGEGDAMNYRLTVSEAGTLELAITEGSAKLTAADGTQADLTEGQAIDLEDGAVQGEVIALPSAPELAGPGMNHTLTKPKEGALALSWSSVEAAKEYLVEVARDASFNNIVSSGTTEGTSYAFTPEAPGEYFWRVAGINAGKRRGEFGAWRRLHITDEELPDALESPGDNAVVSFSGAGPVITFSWKDPKAEGPYRLVVSESEKLESGSVLSEQTGESSFRTKDLGVGTYWWGVFSERPGQLVPLFREPRKLSIRREQRGLRVPKSLKWGK